MSKISEGFDLIKESEASTIMFRKFEKALDLAQTVIYSNSTVEFPGMVIFSSEESGLLTKMLNPGIEIFKVSQEEFEDMLSAVKEEKENVYFIDKHSSPRSVVRLNLNILKDRMIFIKKFDKSILVNETLFTVSGAEFHGAGMFTSRENVFLLDLHTFDKIQAFLEA